MCPCYELILFVLAIFFILKETGLIEIATSDGFY